MGQTRRIRLLPALLLVGACGSGRAALDGGQETDDGVDPGILDEGDSSDTLYVVWTATVAIWQDDQRGADTRMTVSVTEGEGGPGVADAEVLVGPPADMVDASLTDAADGLYEVTVDGYGQTYELEVVRGDDFLEGATVVGPTLNEVQVNRGDWMISWTPHGESGTTAEVFAWCDEDNPSERADEDAGRHDISGWSDCDLFQVVRRVDGSIAGQNSSVEVAVKVQIDN